jgi:hypothetical protein
MKLLKLALVSLCMAGLFGTTATAAKYTVPAECKPMKETDRAGFEACVREKGTKIESPPAMTPAADPVAAPAAEEVM